MNHTRFTSALSLCLMHGDVRCDGSFDDGWRTRSMLCLMSATWLHKDTRSHAIAPFIGLETRTNWMNGSVLCRVLFNAEVNNISEIQSKRFLKPQFTSAEFILCQSMSLKMCYEGYVTKHWKEKHSAAASLVKASWSQNYSTNENKTKSNNLKVIMLF